MVKYIYMPELNKMVTLTLVIAVYNEERHIKACLNSVMDQTVLPDEVLVIDNNSTDKTAAIAAQFPFVRIIHEPVQGLIAARNTGFNAAKSDLIARVDADARLNKDWVARTKKSFRLEDIAGLTGLAYTDTFPGSRYKTRLWSLMYFWMREADFKIRIFWGANMVIRRSVWKHIQKYVCLEDSLVHEDQDMSFLLVRHGYKIKRDNRLLITTNGDEYNELPKLYEYMKRAHMTKKIHIKDAKTQQAHEVSLLPIERLWRLLVVAPFGVLFALISMTKYLLFGGGNAARYSAISEEIN